VGETGKQLFWLPNSIETSDTPRLLKKRPGSTRHRPEICGSAKPDLMRLFARLSAVLLKHLELVALNLSLLPDWFETHSFALVLGLARRLSPASHLSPALVIDLPQLAELQILSVRCRPLLGGRHRSPDTMSMAQSQWSKATHRVEASYLKIA
jgi:hypothetical protein